RVTFFALLALFLVVVWLSLPCYSGDCYGNSFLKELLVGAHGTILEILITGLLVVGLNQRLRQRHESVEYQEQIDSLRGWADSAAGIQILHNVRRLNRNGITSIFLSDAVFDHLDLRGDGEPWGTKRNANLAGSYAPRASFKGAILVGISLKEANLQQATF